MYNKLIASTNSHLEEQDIIIIIIIIIEIITFIKAQSLLEIMNVQQAHSINQLTPGRTRYYHHHDHDDDDDHHYWNHYIYYSTKIIRDNECTTSS
jgi:hypothetical protein